MSIFDKVKQDKRFQKIIKQAPENERDAISKIVEDFAKTMENGFLAKLKKIVEKDEFKNNKIEVLNKVRERLNKNG